VIVASAIRRKPGKGADALRLAAVTLRKDGRIILQKACCKEAAWRTSAPGTRNRL
jgi:hypothetical protein